MPPTLAELETPAGSSTSTWSSATSRAWRAVARDAGVRVRPHAKTHKTVEIATAAARGGRQRALRGQGGRGGGLRRRGLRRPLRRLPGGGRGQGPPPAALWPSACAWPWAWTASRARGRWPRPSRPPAGPSTSASRSTSASIAWACSRSTPSRWRSAWPGCAASASRACSRTPATPTGRARRTASPAWAGRRGASWSETADRLRAAGLPVDDVSVGSTPTARHAIFVDGVTECRPGNYVYHDASQVALGTCALDDCALTVVATVVSVPAPDRAVVDAGSKTLSSDPLRPREGGSRLGARPAEPAGPPERGARGRRGGARRVLPGRASASASCPTTPAWCRTCTTAWSACAARRWRRSCAWRPGVGSPSVINSQGTAGPKRTSSSSPRTPQQNFT